MPVTKEKPYRIPSDTLAAFHASSAKYRCIVGPVGSGKTSAAAMEVGYYLPLHLLRHYGIRNTRWAVIRNTYWELENTTKRSIIDADEGWFPGGREEKAKNWYHIRHNGITAQLVFRSCDRAEDIKKLKSLQLTGYWIDESIEVPDEIKRMLKNRIGRYPQKVPEKFGIETTNPPDIEDSTYWMFKWNTPPPGPVPQKQPLEDHEGFWQQPYENAENLSPGYYQDLRNAYREDPDWIDMYILGKPGAMKKGKLVYDGFSRDVHVASASLVWPGNCPIIIGWDNSGNTPAACAMCIPTPRQIHILKEWTTEREDIGSFAQRVTFDSNTLWPGASFVHPDDPAGHNQFSTREGGFTSNAEIMAEYGIQTVASEQNFKARISAVEAALSRRDGLLIDPSCVRLINGFISGYHYKEIGVGSGIFADAPEKNKYSHIHDALQYALAFIAKPGGPTRGGRARTRRKNLSHRTV